MEKEQIITGRVTMYGANVRAWHIENGKNEIIVHGTPKLTVGDIIVVSTDKVLQLAKNTFACKANEVEIEPAPDPDRYYTDEDVRIMTAARDTMIAGGIQEDDAWDLSYEVVVMGETQTLFCIVYLNNDKGQCRLYYIALYLSLYLPVYAGQVCYTIVLCYSRQHIGD